MDLPVPIDLHHQGAERIIGVYLVETEDGLALQDCGPASCLDALKRGLEDRGTSLGEIRHILLSHIHLDHAGAAGAIVRDHPHVQVHVSAVGAPHLVDPSRLERSARRLYLDAFDSLWGELAPVPDQNVQIAGGRVCGLECFPTPGHAWHHVSYLDREGTLYSGDVAGVRIQPGRYVLPPTPPPDIDLEAFASSLDEIERRAPERLALIHFGVATDVGPHIAQLRARLDEWAAMLEDGADVDEFSAAVRRELEEAGEDQVTYYRAMPYEQTYLGLRRYLDQRREGAQREAGARRANSASQE
jgi:glyoxylase-like metal-dependent hydrolase (beta-lactamase superfamily II)